MLRLTASAVVNVTVPDNDIELLGQRGRDDGQTNQRAFHGAIEKLLARDVDLNLRDRSANRDESARMGTSRHVNRDAQAQRRIENQRRRKLRRLFGELGCFSMRGLPEQG